MEEMVAESGISRYTIMPALQRGDLHGGQVKKRGTWRVQEDCFYSWLRGDRCEHRATA